MSIPPKAELAEDKSRPLVMALAGNPNSGKTTIFNAITGARHHVGNYPGVTVERREGETIFRKRRLRVIDLPGTYSLTASSPDERVARRVLLEEQPDVVIQIVDAGNLERSLYLSVQLLEMKAPLVLAFNMMDEVEKKGMRIDIPQLSRLLGVPIVPTVGARRKGIEELLAEAVTVGEEGRRPGVEVRYGGELDRAVEVIQAGLGGKEIGERYAPRWLAVKLLEGDAEVEEWVSLPGEDLLARAASRERGRLKKLLGDDPEILLADARYGWIHGAVTETVKASSSSSLSLTDRVDAVLAHRILGLPLFLFFMWLTFTATFTLGRPFAGMIQIGMEKLSGVVAALFPPGWEELESLIVDGVISGVGGVLVFLPNIMILFFMVAVMEDSGYMARAAFLVDRVMHLLGLHGKSFIPLFLGFGCNVPAVMASRVLESERDRITTILVTPYMSCSARLPLYVLLAGAFFPGLQGTVVFSLYLLGIIVAMSMARLLRSLVVRGPDTPFVMELPPYRFPTLKSLFLHMWERAWLYLKKAGTIILAFSLLVWFFSSYPRRGEYRPELQAQMEREKAVLLSQGVRPKDFSEEMLSSSLQARLAEERLANSYAGRYGRLMAPLLAPIGLGDWKIGVTLTSGFAAKEIVVATLGTLYSLRGEEMAAGAAFPGNVKEEEGKAATSSKPKEEEFRPQGLQEAISRDPFFSPLRAYVLMVFVLLYVPCLATVAVAARELGSWRWTAVMVAMNLSVAYVVAAVVYWAGRFLGLGLV